MNTRFDGHTKGPWHVDGFNNGTLLMINHQGGVLLNTHDESGDIKLEDAELMAAAPDLLAELVECREAYRDRCDCCEDQSACPGVSAAPDWPAGCRVAKRLAAIDKLTGVPK